MIEETGLKEQGILSFRGLSFFGSLSHFQHYYVTCIRKIITQLASHNVWAWSLRSKDSSFPHWGQTVTMWITWQVFCFVIGESIWGAAGGVWGRSRTATELWPGECSHCQTSTPLSLPFPSFQLAAEGLWAFGSVSEGDTETAATHHVHDETGKDSPGTAHCPQWPSTWV